MSLQLFAYILSFFFIISIISVYPRPSNSRILSDLLQLELLWAHPVKPYERTNAQLTYKYDDNK